MTILLLISFLTIELVLLSARSTVGRGAGSRMHPESVHGSVVSGQANQALDPTVVGELVSDSFREHKTPTCPSVPSLEVAVKAKYVLKSPPRRSIEV